MTFTPPASPPTAIESSPFVPLMHDLLRRLRHVLAPEVVDDPVGRERAVRVHEQQRQERTRLASSQQHLPIAVADVERSEDAEPCLPPS
jgi:hypothetical protein